MLSFQTKNMYCTCNETKCKNKRTTKLRHCSTTDRCTTSLLRTNKKTVENSSHSLLV